MNPVHSDPDIMGGALVFRGTRVPVKTLFEYIKEGDTLDEFLDQFPSVPRSLAIAVLDQAELALPTDAHSA